MMKFVLASFVLVLLAVNVDAQDETCISEETTFAAVGNMIESVGNPLNTASGFGKCDEKGLDYSTGFRVTQLQADPYYSGLTADTLVDRCENTCKNFCMTKDFSALLTNYAPGFNSEHEDTNSCPSGFPSKNHIVIEEFCKYLYDDDENRTSYTIVSDGANHPKGCSKDDSGNYYFNDAAGSAVVGRTLICTTFNSVEKLGVDNFQWPYDATENPHSLTSPSSYHADCSADNNNGHAYDGSSTYTCYCNLNPCTGEYHRSSSAYRSFLLNTIADRCDNPEVADISLNSCQQAYDADTSTNKTFSEVTDVTKPTGCSKVGDEYTYNSLTTSNNDNLGDFDSASTLLCSACSSDRILLGATGCPNGVKSLFESSSEVVNRSPSCGELTFSA